MQGFAMVPSSQVLSLKSDIDNLTNYTFKPNNWGTTSPILRKLVALIQCIAFNQFCTLALKLGEIFVHFVISRCFCEVL